MSAGPDAEGEDPAGAAGPVGAAGPAGERDRTDGPGVRAEFGLLPGGPWRRRRFAALLVAAGALAGALATFVGASLAGPAGLPTDAGPAAKVSVDYSAPGAAEPRPPEQDVLQIFAEPANFAEGEAPHLGAEFIPSSIRSVGSVPAEAGYGVYVAQRGTAQYCIIVQNADRTGTSACAGPGTLARNGMRVNATVLGTVALRGNSRMPVLLDLYVVWAPDGSITTMSHPYVDSCVAAPAACASVGPRR